MQTVNVDQWGIVRPEKIRWLFPTDVPLMDTIKSKSLRKFIKKIPTVLSSQEITVTYTPMDKLQFSDWLNFYEKKSRENHFDILASTQWYDQKVAQGYQVEGVLLHQKTALVGGGIFIRKGLEKAIFAFKVSEKIKLDSDQNASLGAILDYLFLETMFEQNVDYISGGRSRNAFGVVNSVGYLDYKLRFGYQPTVPIDPTFLTDVPLNNEGYVLFYGLKNDQLALYSLQPKDLQLQHEVARFATPQCPFVVLTY